MFRLIKVEGDSMSPTLNNGDYILIKKPRPLRLGLIFVIDHPQLGRIVKRLTKIENQNLWFEGNNAASTSTDRIGKLAQTDLIGRALLAITPKGIKRL